MSSSTTTILKRTRLTAFTLILGALSASAFADSAAVQDLLRKGQFSEALAQADQNLQANANDPQLRFLKGVALTEMGRTAEAITAFQALTTDLPDLPEPYNNLAVLYAQQRQYDKARDALEKAIRTHPSYATAHENLGDVYARLASQAYNNALQLDSTNSGAQTKLSLIRDMITTAVSPGSAPAKTPVAAPPMAPKALMAAVPAKAPAAVAAAPAAAADTLGAEGAIADQIQAWAGAWTSKDMPNYLAAYSPKFTADGLSRSAWEKQRQQRIADKSGKIEVKISDMQISINGDKATAKFLQDYRAAGYKSAAPKTLRLENISGKWLIVGETSGR